MNSSITQPAYPTIKQSWGLLGITVLLAIALNIILLLFITLMSMTGKQATAETFVTHSFTFLSSYVILFGLVIWIAVRKKIKWEGSFTPDFSVPSPTILLFITLATLGIYVLIDPIVDLIPMPRFVENIFLQLLGDQNMWTVIAVVVAAPLCEELLLRGIILDGLLKRYSPKKAIIWSAFFFGIFHFNPWQFIAAFAIGIFMGWIYYRTRSLVATIFIHFIANGTGVVLSYFLLPDSDNIIPTRDFFNNDVLYFGFLAVSLVILVTSIMRLKKEFGGKETVLCRQ